MRIGESRHKAKNEVREERKAQGKDLSAVNIRIDTDRKSTRLNSSHS